jgi:hypothetical protein
MSYNAAVSKIKISPQLKTCRNCKHYHSSLLGDRFGKCLKIGEDPKVQYSYANIARMFDCKGNYFQEKEHFIEHFFKNGMNKNENENNKTEY